MNFFRRLKAAWMFLSIDPFVDLPKDFWTIGDAQILVSKMSDESGLKLGRILANRVARAQMNATLKASDRFDQGYACGCRATTALIDSLGVISVSERAEESEENPEPLAQYRV